MRTQYHIVLAVAAFIKDSKNRILIVKKSPDEKVDGGLWTVPGGKVYPQEGILNALFRETHEECGLTITTHQWIGEDVFENGGFWYHGQHFLCRVQSTQNIILEKSLLEHFWVSKINFKKYEFHPNIYKRLQELL